MTGTDHYHHGALREALVAEALDELEAGGPDSLSLRAVAGAVGVSKTAPYRHFIDKHDLMIALAAEGFGMLAEQLEKAAADSPSAGPEDFAVRLRSLFRAYLEFARARPGLYRLMFSRLGYSLHSEACRLNSLRALGVLTKSIEEAQGLGWRRGQDSRALILSVWAMVHGWAGLLIDGLLPEEIIGPVEDPIGLSLALLD